MQTNPFTEVSALVISALLIIGGALLLYLGKIDFIDASFMFTGALGIFGIHGALKAPSPAQQQQLASQHQDLQLVLSQVLSVLPNLFASQQPAPQAEAKPVPLVQPVQPAPVSQLPVVQQVPFPASSTFPLPVVPKS